MAQLIDYGTHINHFYTDEAIVVLKATFSLSSLEEREIRAILDKVYKPLGSLSKDKRAEAGLSSLKKTCEEDFGHFVREEYDQISPLHQKLTEAIRGNILFIGNKSRNINLFHTITRTGEFFYLTDSEMKKASENIESFIMAGDCKLFDYINSPYPDKDLTGSLETDIKTFEPDIRSYLDRNGLPDIPATSVLSALETIKKWMNDSSLTSVPIWARGPVQVCQEIRKAVSKASDQYGWRNPGNNGILSEFIMKKLSGFCLNKELFFRRFLDATRMPSWKNPEGSWFYGVSKYPWNPNYFLDMHFLSFWDMDVIYYSLGKGPWDKSRYVGQPCAFYQNVAEPLAQVVKRVIKRHHDQWTAGEAGVYNGECINIYDNFGPLLDMVSSMVDSIAIDFSSYSDYLSRGCFDWIMKYMWGVPAKYRQEISFLMSLPIKVNGKVYPHKHGSVMGIKINFLLISFANLLMWMISNVISGLEDSVKVMGDDRIQVSSRPYTEEEVKLSLAATAYFNCVVNYSKTEWLKRDGYTSFCKRTFIEDGIQVSGFSGEYYLKQKPFLNDLSVWLNTCYHNQIPITEEGRDIWMTGFYPYYQLTYVKFLKEDTPPLIDLIRTQLKVPFTYGGWSLQVSDDAMDQIMLRSVLNTVANIMEESAEESKSSPRIMIKNYLYHNAGPNNRYYQNLLATNSYLVDYERISEGIEIIGQVLSSPHNSLEELQKARQMAQRVMRIVLDRDSKLANSTSTKNRIRYTFDQDRVAKVRTKYLDVSAKEGFRNLQESVINSSIMKDSLSRGYQKGIPEYFRYLQLKERTGCRFILYGNAFNSTWIGMEVRRADEDGTPRTLIKRLEAEDSEYNHAWKNKGVWKGTFVNFEDLTEDEKEIYRLLKRKEAWKMIRSLDVRMNQQVGDAIQFLVSYLTDLMR